MLNYSLRKAILLSVALLWMLFVASNTNAEESDAYVFGAVPQFEPQKLNNIWRPLLKELEKRTGLKFKMQGSSKIPAFEKSFVEGEFDFAYMNPYHMIVAEQKQGYIPIVRDHGRQLFGILVVKKDSAFQKIEDLHGKNIAFPAPNALGAALLMRADLTKFGIDFSPLYVKTHSSVYLHVALGLTQAGGGVKGSFNRQGEDIKNSLRIIYETKRMPPHPVAAHPRVPEHVIKQVQKAFLDIGATPAGKMMLSKVPIKKIGTAELQEYMILKEWGLEKFYVNKTN